MSLVDEDGASFAGLEGSTLPELSESVRLFFDYLDGKLAFPDTQAGRQNREYFNLLLRSAYPEIVIDLADLIYVQHERPAVFLHFDHININLRKDGYSQGLAGLQELNESMDGLFRALADRIRSDEALAHDEELVDLLSEGYCAYLWKIKNFPWDNPLEGVASQGSGAIVDVATGLAGYSMIEDWPTQAPRLILTDASPFIVKGLERYLALSKKSNVEIRQVLFPAQECELRAQTVYANKFLHHLQRPERQAFLKWIFDQIEAGGQLSILDTDLEYQILKQSERLNYRHRLIGGYPETLVEIEAGFCQNLAKDVQAAGFQIDHFDFNEYHDQTDAYSQKPGDNLSLKFLGFEITARKPA